MKNIVVVNISAPAVWKHTMAILRLMVRGDDPVKNDDSYQEARTKEPGAGIPRGVI